MNDPWKEFLDEGVETEKKKLLESIADFLGTFSICVYPNGNYYVTGVHQIVGAPPEAFKEYKAKMKELNDKASDVWKSYQEFVRVARKEGMEETGEEIHVRLDKELKEAVAEI